MLNPLDYISLNVDPHLKELWVNVFNSMKVHTRGEQPTKLLELNRPNEPKDVIKYRLDTYQPITRDPVIKSINSFYHLAKQSDFKVLASDSIKEYLKTKLFVSPIGVNKEHIQDLILKSYLQVCVEDSNGVILILPISGIDNVVPNDMTPTDKLDVDIQYIDSNIIKYIDDKVLVYHIGKKLVDKTECSVYRYVDSMDIFTFEPTSINTDGTINYTILPYYRHEFGFSPFRVLGGIESIKTVGTYQKKDYKYYDTYFTAYNSWANKAIIAASETDAVKVRFSYPYIERETSVCPSCNGKKRTLNDACNTGNCGCQNGNHIFNICNTCNGRGTVIDGSPYGIIERKPVSALQGEVATDRDTIKFYSPPFETINVNKEYWYEMMDKAEQSVSIYQSYNSQSGVAKEYDLEQKRDFASIVLDNMFNLYEFAGRCISMYLKDATEFKVIKPLRYEIRNKQSVLAEMTTVGAINSTLVKPLSLEYIESEYDGIDKTIMEFIVKYDIYYGYSISELGELSAMGMLDNAAFQFHQNAYKWLNEIFNEYTNLTDKKILELINAKTV